MKVWEDNDAGVRRSLVECERMGLPEKPDRSRSDGEVMETVLEYWKQIILALCGQMAKGPGCLVEDVTAVGVGGRQLPMRGSGLGGACVRACEPARETLRDALPAERCSLTKGAGFPS